MLPSPRTPLVYVPFSPRRFRHFFKHMQTTPPFTSSVRLVATYNCSSQTDIHPHFSHSHPLSFGLFSLSSASLKTTSPLFLQELLPLWHACSGGLRLILLHVTMHSGLTGTFVPILHLLQWLKVQRLIQSQVVRNISIVVSPFFFDT
jgi:hypothetical protein